MNCTNMFATKSDTIFSDSSWLSPPSTYKLKREMRIYLLLFLLALSFITTLVILSEIFLSYPSALVLFILPHTSSIQLELAISKLETMEWHTRVQASALACSAFVFLWYKVFIIVLRLVLRLGKFFGLGIGQHGSPTSCASVGNKGTDDSVRRCGICSLGNRHEGISCRLRSFVLFLLAVIIINDSIYNRPRDLPASPLFSPAVLSSLPYCYSLVYSNFIDYLVIVLPGGTMRLTSMAIRTFFICAAEISVLYSVLYFTGLSQHSTVESTISDSNTRWESVLLTESLPVSSCQNNVLRSLGRPVPIGNYSEVDLLDVHDFEESKLSSTHSRIILIRRPSEVESKELFEYIPSSGAASMYL